MYARMTTATGSPANLDEGLRTYREGILPSIESLDGFKGTYTLVNRATGKVVNISLWETEAAMTASAAAVTALRAQAVQGMGGTDSAVETFEVAIQPEEGEGQRLASAVAQTARELEGQVRRFASSDEVAKLRHQVENSLKSFEDWARRRGGGSPPPSGTA